MGKFKPAGRKKPEGPRPGAVSCVVLIVTGIVLVSLLFFLVLRSA